MSQIRKYVISISLNIFILILSTLLINSLVTSTYITIAQAIPPWYGPKKYMIYNVTLRHYNSTHILGVEKYMVIINISLNDNTLTYCMTFRLLSIEGQIPKLYIVKNGTQKCSNTTEVLIPPYLVDPLTFKVLKTNVIKSNNSEFYYDPLTGVLITGYEDFPYAGIKYEYSLVDTDIEVKPVSAPNPYATILLYASIACVVAIAVYIASRVITPKKRVKGKRRRIRRK